MIDVSTYLIAINLITFLFYGIDKLKAIHHKYRISEKMLFTLVILGGFFGGFIGMLIFHHKTKKPLFKYGVPVTCIAWVIILAYLVQNKNVIL